MAERLELQKHTFRIDPAGITGDFREDVTLTFSGPVLAADSAINGFSLSYVNSDKSHKEVKINTSRETISGDQVTFNVVANLQDDSGDDPYTGAIQMLAIAEVDR